LQSKASNAYLHDVPVFRMMTPHMARLAEMESQQALHRIASMKMKASIYCSKHDSYYPENTK